MKINHFTLNTKNNNVTEPEDVDSSMLFYFKNLIKEAQSENGVELLDNTILKLTVENNVYIGTLFDKVTQLPILTTAGALNKNDRYYISKIIINDLYKTVFDDNIDILIPPAPVIIDMLYPTSIVNFAAMKWTGDLSKCLGWIILSPKSIID